jgi:hypothetical protein
MRSVSEKMAIKPGMRAFLADAPPDAVADMDFPDIDLKSRLSGLFDYIHVFCRTRRDLHRQFARLKPHVAAAGRLFVSWPKSGQCDTDLSLKTVIAIGYSHGMVESTTLSVNTTWSAIKFTHPKPGKRYHNSYGQLPGSA